MTLPHYLDSVVQHDTDKLSVMDIAPDGRGDDGEIHKANTAPILLQQIHGMVSREYMAHFNVNKLVVLATITSFV